MRSVNSQEKNTKTVALNEIVIIRPLKSMIDSALRSKDWKAIEDISTQLGTVIEN